MCSLTRYVVAGSAPKPPLTGFEPTDRHGHDLRRAFGIREVEKGREVRPLRNVHKAAPGVG